MHSSRMRTGRSLTVCCSLLPGGVSAWSGGGLLGPQGVSLVPGGLPGWGECLPGPGGYPWSRGVSLVPGGSAWSGGVSAWSGGGLLAKGVLPARGGSPWSGGSAWLGGSPCWGGSPWSRGVLLGPGEGWCLPGPGGGSPETPPVYRITDTCKNITLTTTSLRRVTIRENPIVNK